MADFTLLDSPNLISRKIWVMEKSWNFHTVGRYLPHYTHSNRLKQVQLTDYLCLFRWQAADRQLEAVVWPSSWPQDYSNETFWSAPYIGVTYHLIGRHEHPSIRKVKRLSKKYYSEYGFMGPVTLDKLK